MELKNYSESIRIAIAGCGILPLFIVLQIFYYVDHSLFVDMVVFPDTEWYHSIFVSFRGGGNVPQWVHDPFQQRVLFPFITAIFYNLTYPIMPMSEEWYFFAVNSILMVGVGMLLYMLLKTYTSNNFALLGVWLHNLSYPVVWYFLAGLTDTLGYLFVLICLIILKSYKKDEDTWTATTKDFVYFIVLMIGIVVRESVLITLPVWLYIKYKQKPRDWVKAGYSRNDKVFGAFVELLSPFVICGAFFLYYGMSNKTHFNLPPANWWFVTLLCLVPFVPFVLMWKMNKQDSVYTTTVLLYTLYSLFFAAYDGRFLVLGYPIWVALNLQALEKLYHWAINEKELMNRASEALEHG